MKLLKHISRGVWRGGCLPGIQLPSSISIFVTCASRSNYSIKGKKIIEAVEGMEKWGIFPNVRGFQESHISMAAAERPGNLPHFQRQKGLQQALEVFGWVATSEEGLGLTGINISMDTDKSCWIKKETTSPHPRKEKGQMAESTAGIRCELGEHQRCQQDVLKGLWGICVMAVDVLGMEAEVVWQKLWYIMIPSYSVS